MPSVPEGRWITFVTDYQALPGRRMRSGEHSSHTWTVKETVMSGRRKHILFVHGGFLPVAEAKRKRWQIEV